jgi:hypothetical protein
MPMRIGFDRGPVSRALLLLLSLCADLAFAQELKVTGVEQFTENRGWNEAGIGPHFQMIVVATVSPSGFPTLVYAEQDGVREALTHFAQPSTPDLYVLFQRVEERSSAPWRVVAERDGIKSARVQTQGLARAWQVPLARDVRAAGRGAMPRVSWVLPDLGARAIGRIRVVVRGEPRVHGRFMSALYTSDGLPATATGFTIPQGVLKPGERYVFQVSLEDLEGSEVRNRSMSFSEPYVVSGTKR